MSLDTRRIREHLKQFDFRTLFVEELGWDRHTSHLEVAVDGETFILNAVAEKRGVVVFTCSPLRNLNRLDSYQFPDVAAPEKFDALETFVKQALKAGKYVVGFDPILMFERLRALVGFEELMVAPYTQPAGLRAYP